VRIKNDRMQIAISDARFNKTTSFKSGSATN
jgi:hypothetical protein